MFSFPWCQGCQFGHKIQSGSKKLPGLWGLRLCSCPVLVPGFWDPSTLSLKTNKMENWSGREKRTRCGQGSGENKQLPKVPKTKLFSDAQCPQLFFLLTKKNAIIINPNKDDTQFAATFSKRFGRRVFTSRQPGLTPGKQPPEFPNCVPFSLKETRGYDPWSTTC